MSLSDLYLIRPYEPTDESFIYATWLRSFLYGSSVFKFWEISDKTFYRKYHTVIKNILSSPFVWISCVVLKDDPDVILSYCVVEDKENKMILHWVYTKEGFRKLGIAKELVPENITDFTHITKIGKSIYPPHWRFNPFLI